MAKEPLVEMHRVSVTKDGRAILRDVDLCIDRGERVLIIGPNGSGKSSLIKTITGEYRCDTSVEGAFVRIRGEEHWELFDVRRAFGVVSAELQFDLRRDLTALDAVMSGFFGSLGTNRSQTTTTAMEKRAKEALASVRSAHLTGRRVSTLSMGEARRVLIARALVNEPEALVLDEPMSSLDLTGKHLVRETLSSLVADGKALVLVTHDPSDLLPEMDRVIMMKGGRVFADGGLDLLTEANLTGLFGVPVRLRKVDGRYWAWS